MVYRTHLLLFLFLPIVYGSSVMQFINDFLKMQWKMKPQGGVHLFQCWSTESQWRFIRELSSNNIQSFIMELVNNAAEFKNLDTQRHNDIIIDASCSGALQLLSGTNASRTFTSRNRWLIYLPEWHTALDFDGSVIPLDSEVVLAHGISESEIMLEELYTLGNILIREQIANWKEGRINFVQSPIVSRRRTNLHQLTLKVATKVENNSMFDDASLMVFKHVSSLLNIRYVTEVSYAVQELNVCSQVIEVSSGDGFWNWELADINIGGTKMSNALLDNAAYVPLAVFRTSTGFIFKQPSLSFMKNIFSLPFSNVLWMVTVSLVTAIGLLLYLAFIWESENAHWSDIILLCLGTICLQGYSLEVRLIPSRIIMMMLLLVAVFLYASYAGSIVMFLQSSSNSIHTLDDLLHSGLTLTAEESFRDHEAFNESNALRTAVAEDFHLLMDGLVSVTEGRVAFLVDVLEAYHTISETFEQEYKCGLKIVELFPKGSLDHWITLKKNSEFKEILTLGYLKVHELGLLRREILKVYFKNPECILNGLSFAPVGIVDCYSVMLIILFGTILALIIFLLENVKFRHFIKHKNASLN